ncbi:sodium:solute symporter family protein [Pseudomonas yamanorum]|jgi:SSS family solute:Na+ symporter|uniref:Sodium:solute symporter family protein n=1 Tax=Pseudomonas yamanorum TaxID=515393 RepID=A0A7Y8JNP6_9PSED|nr:MULTISPECIES: sodium:solute symporter family protein [Pseudomonas]MCS3419754.1 SSS family solute:Na+ symporter [Pseudomonas sp. BIGb0558]MCS3439606.1 SSS family solute:Na+ symporter [Pseudomonas sp. BIGb0450]NVZ84516.1 sodium:solute symporter family protein [Pseudomonas yamanorum]NWD26682.1 sodium:solute symporter family protein [Pseudomonas yamanorum]NWE12647.1 sodium:solute symporter family protein [Pseudomonas yamanorum]
MPTHSSWIVLSITGLYMLSLALISYGVRRHSRSANNYTTGGGHFPAFLIGFLMLSEFIGTAVSIGTAQTGFKVGISAAWNLFALALGFVLFAWLLARKYKDLGDNTISGVLARNYGQRTRFATSIITIFALEIVAVSIYASGGAVLASVMQVDRTLAIVIVGVVSVAYVSIGGMRSVIYTNFVHAALKYLGVGLALWFGLKQVGGISQLQAQLPASMFDWTTVGWGQIIAWMIAGIGSIFSTQYVIQAVNTVSHAGKAQRACFYVAVLMVPFGIGAALIGMCSAVLFPNVDSLQAFPTLIASMDQLTAGLVVAGLAGSLFGTISAVSMGSATLLLRDFYEPWFNPEKSDAKSLRFVRLATIAVGLLPIALALTSDKVLMIAFLGKALRASLAVLVLMVFYAPKFGTAAGAFLSIIASLLATVGWFLAGNPWGIDNAYIALFTPLIIMGISHVTRRKTPAEPLVAATS